MIFDGEEREQKQIQFPSKTLSKIHLKKIKIYFISKNLQVSIVKYPTSGVKVEVCGYLITFLAR